MNINRELSNSSWSSDGVHIRLALGANDLMVGKSNFPLLYRNWILVKNNILPILPCGKEEEVLQPTFPIRLEFN